MRDAVQSFHEAVTTALGSAPDTIEVDRLHRFSTSGKRSDQSGWCKLFGDGRAGVFGCFRLGVSEVWTAAAREAMSPAERNVLRHQVAQAKLQREAEQRIAWRKNADLVYSLFRQCRAVEVGDPVHKYLLRRLVVDAYDQPTCIRIHPAMPYVHEGKPVGVWPAMVAPLVNRHGAMVALHRTYLDCDGNKAVVPGPVKKLSPAMGLITGASIRFHEPASGVLGVAEGIETALAARLAAGVPTVAAYSSGALASFHWPSAVRRLVVFGDNDRAGSHAASQLSRRAEAAGLSVSVMTPTAPDADWCDVWASRSAVAVEVAA